MIKKCHYQFVVTEEGHEDAANSDFSDATPEMISVGSGSVNVDAGKRISEAVRCSSELILISGADVVTVTGTDDDFR